MNIPVQKPPRRRLTMKQWVFVACTIMLGIVFLPTTMVMGVGMLPTLVAYLTDKTHERLQTLAVGAMNMAGTFPALMDLWTGTTHSVRDAWEVIASPFTLLIMYVGAAIGVVIYVNLSSIVASIMVWRAKKRLEKIDKRLDVLVEDWGEEVNGTLAFDRYGFPIYKKDYGSDAENDEENIS